MKTSIKKLPKSQMEIWFEISTEEFEKFIRKATSDLGKDLEIQGFRKGKAPREVIEEKIGLGKILAEAADLAVKENYLKVVFEKKIEVISPPQIEILKLAKGNPFEFKAIFSILPEIDLPDYKKIAIDTKRKKISVKEKEVENTLSWLQKSRAKFVFKNKPAQKKDFVEIEFSSPQIEGNRKRKDAFILGEGKFAEGFEENLVDMVSGEEKEFSLVFPKDYFQKRLAGKQVDFQVKMKSVQEVILPEIDDRFAQSLGRFENLIALKESLKDGIKMEKENQESQRVRAEILEKISQKTKLEIPEILLSEEKKRMLERLKNLILEKIKLSFEDYLAKIKKTEKEILDTFSPEAERKIKYSLVLREVSKREQIKATEEEIKTAINKVLRSYPSVGKAEKELDLEKLKSYYKEAIRNEKTLKFLEKLSQSNATNSNNS